MDITVEILATSVPVSRENLRYKVKTWWAHVDVEDNETIVKLPSLPMIQTFYDINDRETTVFVEMWYSNSDMFPVGAMRFLGLVKQRVDNQLRKPAWNPTVEWLEVYDPIEDIVRGRLLLKIDAKFVPSSEMPHQSLHPCINPDSRLNSSYFNNSQCESTVISHKGNHEQIHHNTNNVESSRTSVASINSPITTCEKIPDQQSHEDNDHLQAYQVHNKNPNFQKDIDLDLEYVKAQLNLAVKDRERNRKLLEEQGEQPKGLASGRKSNKNLPEFGDLSPVQTSTSSRRCYYKPKNPVSIIQQEDSYEADDSEVDDVIHLLNQQIKPINQNVASSMQNSEIDIRTERLINNMQKLENLQHEMKHLGSQKPFISGAERGSTIETKKNSHIISPPKRPEGGGGGADSSIVNSNPTIAHQIYNDDMTIYGCGLHVQPKSGNPIKKGPPVPKTSLLYKSVHVNQAQSTSNAGHNSNPISASVHNSAGGDKNLSNLQLPPISRKCAAKFDQVQSIPNR